MMLEAEVHFVPDSPMPVLLLDLTRRGPRLVGFFMIEVNSVRRSGRWRRADQENCQMLSHRFCSARPTDVGMTASWAAQWGIHSDVLRGMLSMCSSPNDKQHRKKMLHSDFSSSHYLASSLLLAFLASFEYLVLSEPSPPPPGPWMEVIRSASLPCPATLGG